MTSLFSQQNSNVSEIILSLSDLSFKIAESGSTETVSSVHGNSWLSFILNFHEETNGDPVHKNEHGRRSGPTGTLDIM